MRTIKILWEEKPLTLILFLAVVVRMLSVLFSKGYGMHDDHFLVIESAQSWVDNFDYNGWLPSSSEQASGHSWFYCGIHYFLFRGMKAIGILDPQIKMYIVRFLHAMLSLITVFLGYKIAELVSGKSTARIVGILLATYWFMPFLSVRNLVEVACVPFLIIPTWMLLKPSRLPFALHFFLAGIIAGIAFSIRFQSILFVGGLGLALLFQKKWKEGILYGIGAVLCMALMQGIIDSIIWGKPFMEVHEYIRYNIEAAQQYIVLQWYMYFALLLGILLPPVSFFLLFGFFRSWKKHIILFLPSFIFLAFHCYFPSKQERFIFPIIPFVIILGMIGWSDFVNTSSFWNNRKKLLRACWIFFWSLNLIPLLVVSVAYSKRSRVEAMVYLSTKPDFNRLVVEESFRDDYTMPPFFYLGKWYRDGYVDGVTSIYPIDSLCTRIQKNPQLRPNYVIFFDEENLDNRIKGFKTCFPNIKYETTIQSGFVDRFICWLNPINRNYTAYIYKIGADTTKQIVQSANLSPIKTPSGRTIKFKTVGKYFYVQWDNNHSLQTLDYKFQTDGADAWFPRFKNESDNYIFLRAGCGSPCWIGIFLPLYKDGKPEIINEYLSYDLDKHYVAYFNYDIDSMEVFNLLTKKKQTFRTGKCESDFKGSCVDTIYFKDNYLYCKWFPETFINSKKGQTKRVAIKI